MWLVFAAIVVISLGLDLVAHRGGHGQSRTAAIAWSIGWIVAALAFAGWIWHTMGGDSAQDFVASYLMEKSLSIDNLFVFLVLFERLRVPPAEQHRVLFWGILGALLARAAFIAGGAALLARWHDLVLVLGLFLLYAAVKTLRGQGDVSGDRLVRFMQRSPRLTHQLDGHRFFTRENGRRVATPLLVALVAIEASDIMFAFDSVPAVFAITEDPFVVYTSNVFAILGLRALYLVVSNLLRGLAYLRYGLAAILALAGAKMLLGKLVHIPPAISLAMIVAILLAAIVPSVRVARRRTPLPHG